MSDSWHGKLWTWLCLTVAVAAAVLFSSRRRPTRGIDPRTRDLGSDAAALDREIRPTDPSAARAESASAVEAMTDDEVDRALAERGYK